MAIRRQAGNLASQVLGYRLKQRGAEADDARTQSRQTDLAHLQAQLQAQAAKDQREQALLTQGLSHPEQFNQLNNAGVQDIAGLPTSKLGVQPEQAMSAAANDIGKVDKREMLPSDLQIEVGNQGRPGFDAKDPRNIEQLMAVRNDKLDNFNLEDENKVVQAGKSAEAAGYGQMIGQAQGMHESAPTKLQDTIAAREATDPLDVAKAGATTGAQFDAEHTPGRMQAGAQAAGLKAGAVSDAELPNQKDLAQTRADMSLTNQTAMDDYRRAHPKATTASIDQKAGADHALTLISDVRSMADEMDKRGMLGALRGRASELAAGSVKSEQLFPNPQDAQLAAQFFSEMGLLQKLTARVHGGVRAAASPLMAQQFDKIISGIGDRHILEGQLDAVAQVMKIYADNPDAPPNLQIPGVDPNAPPEVEVNKAADDYLQTLRGHR